MVKRVLIFVFLAVPVLLWSQLETSADWKRQVYEKEYTFGIFGHTMGYGGNFRYQKFRDGYNKHGLEFELTKIRHPKEVKLTADRSSVAARGYVYDRLNAFYALRVGYIHEHILFDKTDQGTVSMSLIFSGGLSLGLLKPVYVIVRNQENSNFTTYVAERYNHNTHLSSTIYGEAGFFKGFWETKLHPGLYAKAGANFDYNLLDKKVTSLEGGIVLDVYYKEVPIFYEGPADQKLNMQAFVQLYLAFNFGYRKN